MGHQIVGVVGLGLLGRGIASCLLGHGHKVIGYSRSAATREAAALHIEQSLRELVEHGRVTEAGVADWRTRYTQADSLDMLAPSDFVIESIFEDLGVKHETYDKLESVLRPETPIASNTSAIPITLIQSKARCPQRFVGMHWSEPAHATRFMELIRGAKTDDATMEAATRLAIAAGKEPSIVQKDIRGFITNRLCYAMFREALFLLESGVADAQSIDRSFRNDVGFWATIAGPFRWMDLTGLPAYHAVMQDLFPELCNSPEVPATMQKLADQGAQGIRNGRGFYQYSPEQAEEWEKAWYQFTWEVGKLAAKFQVDSGAEAGGGENKT